MSRFQGRTVLITGASSGIGAALAKQFALEGASLVLTARRLEELQKVAQGLPAAHAGVRVLRCDVTHEDALADVVEQVRREGGRIDVVIANAGYGVAGPLQRLALEDYRRQFETNVFGVLRTVYATLPELKRSSGQLVIMGSVAGYVPQPGMSAYGMSKFAIRCLAESLRGELAPEGVSVTLLSPGFVDSDIRRIDNRGVLHPNVQDPVPHWVRARPEAAAREIVNAVYRRKRECIVTGHGRAIVFAYRHFPWLIRLAYRMGLKSRGEPA